MYRILLPLSQGLQSQHGVKVGLIPLNELGTWLSCVHQNQDVDGLTSGNVVEMKLVCCSFFFFFGSDQGELA